jgi:4-amino-4-deoxy-L-arabinose transferase-like glycosyltransferase
MPRKKYYVILSLVVLLAFVPRLWLWADQGTAGVVLSGDEDEYYRGAIHLLLEGSYDDGGQWLRPPMTSIFLAGVFALVGVNLPLAMLVQCVVSVATLLLLAATARSLFASQRAGIAAALMGALFLPYASYASQLLSETLYIFMVALALLLFERARRHAMEWRWLVAGGLAWGLAALTRPVGVYALPLIMLWVAWAVWKARANSGNWFARLRAAGRRAAVVLLGFVLVVAPWSIRNYTVYHHLVLVDTNGGITFWLGNLLEPDERELQGVWNRTIPNSARRQQVAMARALENIHREPLTFLARMRYKTVSLWQLDTRLFVANAPIGITLDERSPGFALASDAEYVLLALLALFGVVLARPSEHNPIILAWPLYGTLISAAALGHPRLRLPLLITLFVYAALPLAHPRHTWDRLRRSSWGRYATLLAGATLFAFLFYAHAYIPFARSQAYLLAARLGGGESTIEQAIAAAPDNYLPYLALAEQRMQQGNIPSALEAYGQAAERAPQNTYTHLQRLDLHRRLGNEEGAQQAMEAIAAVGWDNNLLYEWAWEQMPASAGRQLDVTKPAPGLLRGVYAPEHDGERAFRWTMGRAQVRLGAVPTLAGGQHQPTTSEQLCLSLVLRADQPATPVRVFFHHSPGQSPPPGKAPYEEVATLQVGPSWQQFNISMGDTPGGVLELRAPARPQNTDAPYPRGVALAKAWLHPSPTCATLLPETSNGAEQQFKHSQQSDHWYTLMEKTGFSLTRTEDSS